MTVDAECWVWTPAGMRRSSTSENAYVTVRELERLLEEADLRRLKHEQARREEERA